MGGFEGRGYVSSKQFGPDLVSKLVRPVIAAVLVGVVVFGIYKVLHSGSMGAVTSTDAQLTQMAQRLDDMQRRLDELEKKRKPSRDISALPTPSPVVVSASNPVQTSRLTFSRPIRAQSASTPSSATPSPASNTTQQGLTNAAGTDGSSSQSQPSQQQWEATADRLGNVVGELDSQRDVIERNQAKLDELAGHFARYSQRFTLALGSPRQQVGPVWLRLRTTDPKNQRYTMRLSLNDQTVEVKDRALNEAVQFYDSDGKLSFELIVSQITKDGVAGRLVSPQATASR